MRPHIIGHRANTPRWIAKFFREGANGVEVDVFCHRDRLYAGHLGAPHGLRLLRDKIAALIMSLHLTGPYPVSELLERVPRDAPLMLDLKSTPFSDKCIEEIRDIASTYKTVYVPTREYHLVPRLARLGVTALLSMDHRPVNPLRDVEETGAAGISINYCYLDEEMAEELREAGMVIVAWTVNKPDAARRVVAMGVDAVVTDFPAVVREVLSDGAAPGRGGREERGEPARLAARTRRR